MIAIHKPRAQTWFKHALVLLGAGGFLSACIVAPKWQAQRQVTPELVAQTLDYSR